MARNPRFDVLFDPVRIGPVTAPNRFYQVPHASGMTNALPHVRASFREIKAEGGWGVVCTGAVSIHPSSDDSPLPFASLWDDKDIRAHALMTDAVHKHGSLAGVELWHGGACTLNRTSRIAPLSPSGMPWLSTHLGFMGNLRPRAMDQSDIDALLQWQADGARRAMRAGFDIVYVYAGMGYLPYEFLLPEYNQRSDGYGGSIANRVRLVRELLEVTRDAVGDKCAVALRISLEELRGRPGEHAASEAHEVVALLADVPDLWDVKMDSSPTDCAPSRFSPEGSHEPIIDFVKRVTKKPVVGVGRFTSPDVMVSQIKRGVLDFIGGARPSIADPFLPQQDQRGPRARDPRMHRLQHLHLELARRRAGALHPESDRGRGVAPRLAPRAIRPAGERRLGARRRRGAGGSRGRGYARAPRLFGHDRRPGDGVRRSAAFRDPAAGACNLGSSRRLAHGPIARPAERESVSR
jgi:dimethylamine/trimethylamine dehydrogenase